MNASRLEDWLPATLLRHFTKMIKLCSQCSGAGVMAFPVKEGSIGNIKLDGIEQSDFEILRKFLKHLCQEYSPHGISQDQLKYASNVFTSYHSTCKSSDLTGREFIDFYEIPQIVALIDKPVVAAFINTFTELDAAKEVLLQEEQKRQAEEDQKEARVEKLKQEAEEAEKRLKEEEREQRREEARRERETKEAVKRNKAEEQRKMIEEIVEKTEAELQNSRWSAEKKQMYQQFEDDRQKIDLRLQKRQEEYAKRRYEEVTKQLEEEKEDDELFAKHLNRLKRNSVASPRSMISQSQPNSPKVKHKSVDRISVTVAPIHMTSPINRARLSLPSSPKHRRPHTFGIKQRFSFRGRHRRDYSDSYSTSSSANSTSSWESSHSQSTKGRGRKGSKFWSRKSKKILEDTADITTITINTGPRLKESRLQLEDYGITDLDRDTFHHRAGRVPCVVCRDRLAVVVFLPCKHLKVCELCGSLNSLCPVCEDVVTHRYIPPKHRRQTSRQIESVPTFTSSASNSDVESVL